MPHPDRPNIECRLARPRILTRDQLRALDREAVAVLGLPSVLLMENAAIGAAAVIAETLTDQPNREPAPVLIIAGGGNNGGDGIALARHLCILGIPARLVIAARESDLSPDAAANARALRSTGTPTAYNADDPAAEIRPQPDSPAPSVIVDALLGTGLTRPVSGPLAAVIDAINDARTASPATTVVALDLPTGLDADTGAPLGSPRHPTVKADITVTFAALKPGFFTLEAQPYLGEVSLVPIGVPPEFVARFGVPYEPDRHAHARSHGAMPSPLTGDPAGPGRDAQTTPG